MGVKFLFN